MHTLDDIDLEEKMVVPSYNLTSRAESKSREGTSYIPYKDNFIFFNERYSERYSDIWVSSVRPIEFENSTDLGSDITKKDHEKINELKKTQDTVERKDLLDHDPIVGVLMLTGKRTGSYQRSDVEAAKTQSIAKDEEYEQDEVRLCCRVRNCGLQIRDNIRKDGNCLFRAVSDQLNRLGEFEHYTHTSLRQLAVQTLREESHGLCKDYISEFVPNNDLSAYLTNMERDGTWGGQIELISLARALGRTIKVVSSQGPSYDFVEKAGNPDSAPILLGLLSDERHYVSLEPRIVSENSVG
ncbi:PREDICTED: uncharacterized protein LOC107342821 isoform X2 [Acropora digitifera]|uniref:uncharacterized protein LOC107342821 isoform X2 n=1 Tax=Acropora digitifera TaxID=70779 RepID=UPI00077A5B7B|nr:PREDICTED: uncharacterized protein LOC107342821 isoform X2 [Acropora digitifera]